jgi:hypothetical protein
MGYLLTGESSHISIGLSINIGSSLVEANARGEALAVNYCRATKVSNESDFS